MILGNRLRYIKSSAYFIKGVSCFERSHDNCCKPNIKLKPLIKKYESNGN